MTELEQVKKDQEALVARIAALEKIDRDEGPEEGDEYFCIWDEGEIRDFTWENDAVDRNRAKAANVFRTRDDAELELAIRKMRAGKRWVPDENCVYFYWDGYGATENIWFNHGSGLMRLALGNIHPTKEAAEAWGREHAETLKKLAEVRS